MKSSVQTTAYYTNTVSETTVFSNLIIRYKAIMRLLEKNRYGVLAATLLFQGNITVPICMLAIYFNPASFSYISISLMVISSFALLVMNLALIRVKFIAHLFLINILIGIGIALSHTFFS